MNGQSRILLRNIYYQGAKGISKGFVFIEGGKISDTGEEPPPEYELSDVVYDFEYKAYAIHGYGLLVKGVEYPFRGLVKPDLSVYSKTELEIIALYALASFYSMGISLPIVDTEFPDIFNKIAREHNLQLVIMHEKGSIPHYNGILYVEKENDKLYFNDNFIGLRENIFCRPESIRGDCMILDARELESLSPAAIFASSRDDPKIISLKLREPYRLLGLDEGLISKGSISDIAIYDLRPPLKQQPLIGEILFRTPFRTTQPDIVLIKGEFAVEYGDFILASIPGGIFKEIE
ncbi:MAG: hypothetical protein QW148_01710 [Thermosphaera sp.]